MLYVVLLSYRFLIFPSMGQSLRSVMEEEDELLSEKAVLQLACRIIDALQYIHSNEYVHADINAENIYIKPGQKSQIYLVGYCHAFRYCPGGQHVEYREASRTPHEGTIEFISLDTHKGAGESLPLIPCSTNGSKSHAISLYKLLPDLLPPTVHLFCTAVRHTQRLH